MTRSIHTLRRQIKSLRAKDWKWNDICLKLGILAVGGVTDTGMAYAIANGVKRHGVLVEYEPSEPDVRERLGLSVICKECKRKRVAHKEHSPQKEIPPWREAWNKLKAKERDEVKRFWYETYS